MKREWKPGDVALVTATPFTGPKRTERAWVGSDGCWRFADGHAIHVSRHDLIENARPLVVIDPEDRQSARHLLAEFCCAVDASDIPAHPQGWSIDAMQAALREFADPKPPKPEEPTGLGAVVEAIYDNHFVRVGSAGWVHADDPGGTVYDWRDIAAVRVLSDGVTP